MTWVVGFAWGGSSQRTSYFYKTEDEARKVYGLLVGAMQLSCSLAQASTNTMGAMAACVEFENNGALMTVRLDLIGEVVFYESQWGIDIAEEQSRFFGKIDIVGEEARKVGRRDGGESEVGFKS